MSLSTWNPLRNNISSITQAFPAVVTTASNHNFLAGTSVRFFFPPNEYYGMEPLFNQVFLINVLSPTTFSIPVDTTNFNPFNSGTSNITGITNANPAVISVATNNFQIGQQVIISGVAGMTQINGQYTKVISVGSGTITVPINTFTFGTYSGGGTVQVSQAPQVFPVAETANTLANAERNTKTPIGGKSIVNS